MTVIMECGARNAYMIHDIRETRATAAVCISIDCFGTREANGGEKGAISIDPDAS